MLTLWVLGCVSWLPALALEMTVLLPLCVLAMFSPGLYVRWRQSAHARHRLRCDWLDPAG